MQDNAAIPTLTGILAKVDQKSLAASIEALDTAVEIVLGGHRPASLIVFEYASGRR